MKGGNEKRPYHKESSPWVRSGFFGKSARGKKSPKRTSAQELKRALCTYQARRKSVADKKESLEEVGPLAGNEEVTDKEFELNGRMVLYRGRQK